MVLILVPHQLGQRVFQRSVAQFKAGGLDAVEYHLVVVGALHQPQVVDSQVRMDLPSRLRKPQAHILHLRVAGNDRVHVDHQGNAAFRMKIALDLINQFVAFEHIILRRHLHMDTGKAAAGAVIMQHQVMRAQHAGIGHDALADFFHRPGIGRCAQQGVDGVADQPPAGPEDKDGHGHSHPPVDAHLEEILDDKGEQHGGG